MLFHGKRVRVIHDMIARLLRSFVLNFSSPDFYRRSYECGRLANKKLMYDAFH